MGPLEIALGVGQPERWAAYSGSCGLAIIVGEKYREWFNSA